MKRRDFLASAAALSLFSAEALAAKKKSEAKPASKPAAGKPTTSRSRAKPAPASTQSRGPVVHTAEDPITEKPPQGTSASRLPPVKAAEPPADWRTYEISTTVTVKAATGQTRLWL
ncbi:MAG: hypothetical protein WCD32_13480, partial [Azonexus sp.]